MKLKKMYDLLAYHYDVKRFTIAQVGYHRVEVLVPKEDLDFLLTSNLASKVTFKELSWWRNRLKRKQIISYV